MKSNTMIRTLTLTFIVFCFIAMYALASFSAPAGFHHAASQPGMMELSACTEQSGLVTGTLPSLSGEGATLTAG